MRNALFIAIGIIAIAAVIAFYPAGRGQSADAPAGPARLAGTPALSFPVKGIDGRPDELARYRGKIVVLNLWATWCPPCVREFPDLQRLYRQYAKRGVIVLGVDQGESAASARRFAAARGVTFPILIDEEQRYGSAYSALGLPTTVIVDRSGRILRGIDGALSLPQMQSLVQSALQAG